MYAIIKTGGKQYRVSEGDVVYIEKLDVQPEETVNFEEVIAVGKEDGMVIGAPVVEGAKVVAFNTQSEASMELRNGGADAVINDAPVVGYYLAQGGAKVAKTVGEVMEAEEYGIAVNKKNTQLAQDINKALAELKKNGEFDKIYKTWFGESKK